MELRSQRPEPAPDVARIGAVASTTALQPGYPFDGADAMLATFTRVPSIRYVLVPGDETVVNLDDPESGSWATVTLAAKSEHETALIHYAEDGTDVFPVAQAARAGCGTRRKPLTAGGGQRTAGPHPLRRVGHS